MRLLIRIYTLKALLYFIRENACFTLELILNLKVLFISIFIKASIFQYKLVAIKSVWKHKINIKNLISFSLSSYNNLDKK